MAKRRQLKSSQSSTPVRRTWVTKKTVLRALGGLGLLSLLCCGRPAIVALTRTLAVRALQSGAVFDAQWWVGISLRIDSRDPRTALIEAACFRQLQQFEFWSRAIEKARSEAPGVADIEQEVRLANTSLGEIQAGGGNPIAELIQEGVPVHDVAAAYVHGYLRREEPEKALMVLDGWSRDSPDDVRQHYLRGVIERWLSHPARAETLFRGVLDQRPRHDLSRIALAQMLEQQNRLEEALSEYVILATRAPPSANIELDLSRVLRKQGRVRQAVSVLQDLLSRPHVPADAKLELGLAELESGNFDAAAKWLADPVDGPEELKRLTAEATLSAFKGDSYRAAVLFDQADLVSRRSLRIHDLQVRLTVDPKDKNASEELQALSRQLAAPSLQPPSPTAVASDLFRQHCAACHGQNGDGTGPAARYLFPRPRNLRSDPFRLVSSSNGIPTPSDIRGVIRGGMPGTSMPANAKLTDVELDQLLREVQQMMNEGIRERLIAQSTLAGVDLPSPEEIAQTQASRLTPQQAISPPEFQLPDADRIARGKKWFLETGCHSCHGADGTGSPEAVLFDAQGQLSRPRDLVREPNKGGTELSSMFLRIRLGMPGTAHPACPTLSTEELVDLVHFCRSLSREPKRTLTNHEREQYGTARAYLDAVP